MDLQYEIFQTTLAVYLRALFSTSISDQEIRQLDADMRAITGLLGLTTLMVPYPNLLPLPGKTSLLPALARIYRLVGRLVRERQARPAGGWAPRRLVGAPRSPFLKRLPFALMD